MHSFKVSDDITIFHHGDFSGDVLIVDKEAGMEIAVPMSGLQAIVAEQVRRNKIRVLEQMTTTQILELPPWLR